MIESTHCDVVRPLGEISTHYWLATNMSQFGPLRLQ